MTETHDQGAGCNCGGTARGNGGKQWIWIILALAVVGAILAGNARKNADQPADTQPVLPAKPADAKATAVENAGRVKALPKMVDLGAGKCIPCKMMAPILEELKTNYAGRLDVEFVDVWVNPDAGKPYNIKMIPTQIFYDAAGKELFRHEGFFSREDILAKWKEFGVDLTSAAANIPEAPAAPEPGFSRWTPAQADTRSKDTICCMCDGTIPSNSLVVVKTDKGDVRLCGMHHYFVMYSCLTEDRTGFEKKVTVADCTGSSLIPVADAVYVYTQEAKTGRPVIRAFADRTAAGKEITDGSGTLLSLAELQAKELKYKCGFCDRAVYEADSTRVAVIEMQSGCCGSKAVAAEWLKACCPMCALGISAKLQKDIEMTQKDALTGEDVLVRTADLKLAWRTPTTAVAWYGQRSSKDGKPVSAGCFHQQLFATPDNLKKWVEANPLETGEQISIARALADKIALTPEQIAKACKIGECVPK